MLEVEEHIFLGLRGDTPLFAPLIRAEPGQRAWSVFALLNRWRRGHGGLGHRPQPDRMAQPPPLLRRLRIADDRVSRRLGPALQRLRPRAFPARRPGRDHARRA
jgi:hypothetical protein